jgi:hypothetical protein
MASSSRFASSRAAPRRCQASGSCGSKRTTCCNDSTAPAASQSAAEIGEIFLKNPVVGRGVGRSFGAGHFLAQESGKTRLKLFDLPEQTLILLPVVGLFFEGGIVEAAENIHLAGAPGGIVPSQAAGAIVRRGPGMFGASRTKRARFVPPKRARQGSCLQNSGGHARKEIRRQPIHAGFAWTWPHRNRPIALLPSIR